MHCQTAARRSDSVNGLYSDTVATALETVRAERRRPPQRHALSHDRVPYTSNVEQVAWAHYIFNLGAIFFPIRPPRARKPLYVIDNIVPHILALAGAYALAAPIGWDREQKARSAGLRTFPLVAMASCGFIQATKPLLANSPEGMARVVEAVPRRLTVEFGDRTTD